MSGAAPAAVCSIHLPVLGRDCARALARHELAKPLYHRNDPSLAQRLASDVVGWVAGLVGHLASAASAGGGVGLLGLAVVAAVVAALAYRRFGGPAARTGGRGTGLVVATRRASEHRAAAERLAAEQRWDEAVRERMRAFARELEERSLLDAGDGRTADELALEAARGRPQEREAFASAARSFDDVAYGGRPADRRSYRAVSRADDLVR